MANRLSAVFWSARFALKVRSLSPARSALVGSDTSGEADVDGASMTGCIGVGAETGFTGGDTWSASGFAINRGDV